MLAIFLKTLPFFALIGLGWLAGRRRFFPAEATAWLTKFVFFFALSAMLFNFAATLSLGALFDPVFALAYVCGTGAIWVAALLVGRLRGIGLAESAMEAYGAGAGNTGFLGVPMLVLLLGKASAAPVLLVLTLDMLVFSTLVTVLVAAARQGRVSVATFTAVGRSLLGNPMIVSMVAGLAWSALGLPMPAPAESFLTMLGGAATPCALFAIGASLATKQAGERLGPALWISAAKLGLHPAAVALCALVLFPVEPFAAAVMISTAALPVAGNVYILAQHFGTAANRISTAILVSTVVSILSMPAIIALATR